MKTTDTRIVMGSTVTLNGRVGRVIEMDMLKPRVRVAWVRLRQGDPYVIRTWVEASKLQLKCLCPSERCQIHGTAALTPNHERQ